MVKILISVMKLSYLLWFNQGRKKMLVSFLDFLKLLRLIWLMFIYWKQMSKSKMLPKMVEIAVRKKGKIWKVSVHLKFFSPSENPRHVRHITCLHIIYELINKWNKILKEGPIQCKVNKRVLLLHLYLILSHHVTCVYFPMQSLYQ